MAFPSAYSCFYNSHKQTNGIIKTHIFYSIIEMLLFQLNLHINYLFL